jgi:hypothetical protein
LLPFELHFAMPVPILKSYFSQRLMKIQRQLRGDQICQVLAGPKANVVRL